ncbi:MAG: glutamate-5-semialdehyde dehydrogenase [Ruminococcaceae bacterium]|nr:glutamate-5-semialdehyde dehydrogenase [Oscillospiraceae bacterium]
MTALQLQGQAAKQASRILATAGTNTKNDALLKMADAILENEEYILSENAKDLENAVSGGMSKAMLDRLSLDHNRILSVVDGLKQVAAAADPIGEFESTITRPNGLVIGKKRVPLGVIAIIYEARPNVTVDAAALCLKSGNAVILRGGKEAILSNTAFVTVMRNALKTSGLPEDCVSLVADTSRASANELMTLSEYVDVLIPRGGAGLIRSVVEGAKVPVIETGVGNCHVYADDSADLEMAANIIYNAKCSRPSVCNAAETLLVARSIAKQFLPMAKKLLDKNNTRILGCAETRAILEGIEEADEAAYATEFGDYVLAVKVVSDIDEAIEHITKYSTGHSECIVTSDYFNAQRFLNEVDAAAVYVNASTRFTDGGEFGLGAEIGISTQKMHARGPMGLYELTSSKFIIYGNGQVR